MIIIKIILSVLIMISISILPAYAESELGSGGPPSTPASPQNDWSKIYEDQSLRFKAIFFIDDNNGWIASSSGEILHTTDGGETWEEQFRADNRPINDIFFLDKNNGWAIKDSGLILHTTDGGEAWEEQYFENSPSMNDIFFTDDNNGWIASDDGEIFRTIDGGETWEKIFSDDWYMFEAVFFLNANNGWVIDEIGVILHTTDGGVTWEEQLDWLNDPYNFIDIFFADANNGWVVGYPGLILHTTDGGETWEEQRSSGEDRLHSIVCIADNNLWVVGQFGMIFHTTDGGETWEDDSIVNENSEFNKIFFNNSKGWIISSDGEIYAITLDKTVSGKDLDVGSDDDSDDDSDDNSDNDKDEKKNGGGCSDCIPPTLGLDVNFKRIVDNGFSYNDNPISVEKYHTPFPLINATVGETNRVSITAFENFGINNMDMVQFGLGAKEIGEPLSTVEVLIEVHLVTTGTTEEIYIENIVIRDKNNLINNDSVFAYVFVVDCQDADVTPKCVKVDLFYSYRESTINHVMVVNVSDKNHNAQNFYFNDGVQVLGLSQNPIPYIIINNKHSSQQTEDLTKVLFRTDKINHIWVDGYGIEYIKISDNTFDRITPNTPYQCNDPPLDEINVPTRKNCNFRALVNIWDK